MRDIDKLKWNIDNPPPSVYHEVGDGWEYWDDLNNAINELSVYIKKSKALAWYCEKNGHFTLDIISVYNGSLKSILQPSLKWYFEWRFDNQYIKNNYERLYNIIKNYIEPCVNVCLKYFSKIDNFIAHPHLPFYKYDINKPIRRKIDSWIRKHISFIPHCFIKFIVNKQMHEINKGFQIVCLKYPHLVHELLADTNCYAAIIPFDNYIVDGVKIKKMRLSK